MSHHLLQIGSGVADASSSLTINNTTCQYILFGQGTATSGDVLGSYTVNNTARFFDSSPVNQITGATINEIGGAAGYLASIDLPAGQYLIGCTIGTTNSTVALEYSCVDGSTSSPYSGNTRIINAGNGTLISTRGYQGQSIIFVNFSTATNVKFPLSRMSTTNTITTDLNTIKSSSVLILKV